MDGRLAVLALVLAVCNAFPQRHSSYTSLPRPSYGSHQLIGRGFNQYAAYRNYGHRGYAVPVVPKFAGVAPIAKVVPHVSAIGKRVANPIEYYAEPKYQYEYAVEDRHTGDIKSHHEERNGDNTRGYYTVHEPDGTILTVHYIVNKHSGFLAEVNRRGHATHPAPVKKFQIG